MGAFFLMRFPSNGKLHHIGNEWVSPWISRKCNKTYRMGRTWQICTHTISIVWATFSREIPILWYTPSYQKCMEFPVNFPEHAKRNPKSSIGGKLGKLIPILFTSCGCFFPIRFPCYGILHHMGNAWVFSSISKSIGNDSKIHWIGKVWKIGFHTFL